MGTCITLLPRTAQAVLPGTKGEACGQWNPQGGPTYISSAIFLASKHTLCFCLDHWLAAASPNSYFWFETASTELTPGWCDVNKAAPQQLPHKHAKKHAQLTMPSEMILLLLNIHVAHPQQMRHLWWVSVCVLSVNSTITSR